MQRARLHVRVHLPFQHLHTRAPKHAHVFRVRSRVSPFNPRAEVKRRDATRKLDEQQHHEQEAPHAHTHAPGRYLQGAEVCTGECESDVEIYFFFSFGWTCVIP